MKRQAVDIIEERRQEINNLCKDLRWVYRGYYTSLYDYLENEDILDGLDEFVNNLISLNNKVEKSEKAMYKTFLTATILFLKTNCLPHEMIFYSVYKISATIEDCIARKCTFEKSTFFFFITDNVEFNDNNKYIKSIEENFKAFGKMYDDKTISKSKFTENIVDMIDILLYDDEKSFLCDKAYREQVNNLNRFIGASRFKLNKMNLGE